MIQFFRLKNRGGNFAPVQVVTLNDVSTYLQNHKKLRIIRKIIVLIFILIPVISFSQEKIGNKTYFYGKLKEKIKGQTAVRFNFHNPKVVKYTLQTLMYEGLNPKSWNSMFLPETDYTEEEMYNTLQKNGIDNIIFVKIGEIEKGNYTYGMSLTYSTAYYSNIELIELVKITIEFYNIKDTTTTRPEWIVIGEASGGTEFSTITSVSKKIIRRMIYGLDKKGVFEY